MEKPIHNLSDDLRGAVSHLLCTNHLKFRRRSAEIPLQFHTSILTNGGNGACSPLGAKEYMIKTVSRTEAATLHAMLSNYQKYLAKNKDSFITRFGA